MELPVDVEKLSIIVIGEALPVFVYGTQEKRKNAQGQDIYKLPVLIQNTGDRQDPTQAFELNPHQTVKLFLKSSFLRFQSEQPVRLECNFSGMLQHFCLQGPNAETNIQEVREQPRD